MEDKFNGGRPFDGRWPLMEVLVRLKVKVCVGWLVLGIVDKHLSHCYLKGLSLLEVGQKT